MIIFPSPYMQHSKARRIGGKGTPRLPPKKQVTTPAEIHLNTLTRSFTTLAPKCAIINTPEGMQIFDKPGLKVCQGSGKVPVAYLLTGKGVSQAFPSKNEGDLPLTQESLVDQMLDEESELRKEVLKDFTKRDLEVPVEGIESMSESKRKIENLVGEEGVKKLEEFKEEENEIDERMGENIRGDSVSDMKSSSDMKNSSDKKCSDKKCSDKKCPDKKCSDKESQ